MDSLPFLTMPAHTVPTAFNRLLETAEEQIDNIVSFAGQPSFANTFGALDRALQQVEVAVNCVETVEAVAGSTALREAWINSEPAVTRFWNRLYLNKELWSCLDRFARSDTARSLPADKHRHMQKVLREFKRQGAGLSDRHKRVLAQIDAELQRATSRFEHNLIDAMNASAFFFEDDRDLASLPDWVRDQTRAEARKRGRQGHCFTLKAGLVSAVLECAESRLLRRIIWTAFNSIAAASPFDNRPVINRILDLRRRRARLLGSVSFAEHVLQDRMIGSPAAAVDFLEALREKTRPFFDREVAQLRNFAIGTDGEGAAPIAPYDEAYLSEGLRRKHYHFGEEELRPYFPLQAVLEGIFEIIFRLFGCRVVEKKALTLWHPDARSFEVVAPDGALVGRFFGDFHARPGKREGAWVRTLEWEPPSGPQTVALITNFLPPPPDRPCLLAHREVRSLFHEFGHLLHFLLSRAPTRALSADEVAWDFVEVPSQLFANWCWEVPALRLFARHWQTGADLPAEKIEALKRSRDFGVARDQMRQIGIAQLDIALHNGWPRQQGGDATAFARDLLQDHVVGDLPDEYALICRFAHAFKDPEGSASGYYGYLWSEVMEADIFSDFQTQGLFNKDLGDKLKNTVLSIGDGRDAQDSFLAFKGRSPDIGALLRRNGMV